MPSSGRRSFLSKGLLATGLGWLAGQRGTSTFAGEPARQAGEKTVSAPPFKLGLVTYNLAKDWDIGTIIENCSQTGFEGAELRTTHKHGVELSLSKPQRAEVRKRFADSPVRLVSLGTTCEYESPDPAVVAKNIEETKRWCELAQAVGCLGIKVRPNGFPKGVPEDKTLAQIGHALAKCGDAARDHGVEIWLEVHGRGTELPPNIHRIMEVANHPAVGVCWNSNDTDLVDGSVRPSFDLLKPWLRSCHINELWRTESPWHGTVGLHPAKGAPGFPDWGKPYPWHELFRLFRDAHYSRYTFAEIPESCEPLRLMHYYRALWEYHAA
jgi:sugar phosphate isomerase/epimerase